MEVNWEEYLNRENKKESNYCEKFLPFNETKLREFSKRNLAIQIFSNILNEQIWLCSNEIMKNKIIEDDPGGVCYTADELLEIIKLDLTKERLKRFHDLKKAFRGKVAQVSSVI